jgi:hypothetical protein
MKIMISPADQPEIRQIRALAALVAYGVTAQNDLLFFAEEHAKKLATQAFLLTRRAFQLAGEDTDSKDLIAARRNVWLSYLRDLYTELELAEADNSRQPAVLAALALLESDLKCFESSLKLTESNQLSTEREASGSL